MFLGHGLWFLFPVFLIGKLFWLLLLAMIIGAVVRRFAFRNRWRTGYYPHYHQTYGQFGPTAQPSALDILKLRYARGEIDAVTYEQMRERLESSEKPKE
jgi:putative membrane protein